MKNILAENLNLIGPDDEEETEEKRKDIEDAVGHEIARLSII